jgi:hypothetical protein
VPARPFGSKGGLHLLYQFFALGDPPSARVVTAEPQSRHHGREIGSCASEPLAAFGSLTAWVSSIPQGGVCPWRSETFCLESGLKKDLPGKRLLRRLFPRMFSATPEEATDYQTLNDASGGLNAEYEKLIVEQLRRWGVSDRHASVEVRQVDIRQGKEVFVGMVRLLQWNRDSALRVLLGLPMLEKKIRKRARAIWVSDVSHFDGIWLQASSELQTADAVSELRRTLVATTRAVESRGS